MDHYEALVSSTNELRRQLENHQRLLKNTQPQNGWDFCASFQCPHEQNLRAALKDVIETLEETRQNFKSKQLESLRKRMLDVLCSTQDPR